MTRNSSGEKSTVVCGHGALSRERSLGIPEEGLDLRIMHFLPYSLALEAWHLCICTAISTGIFHWKINSCQRNDLFIKKSSLASCISLATPMKIAMRSTEKLPRGQLEGPVWKWVNCQPCLGWFVGAE